jgi:hypothetical protein
MVLMELISSVTREDDLPLTALTLSSDFQVRFLPVHESLLIRENAVEDYRELLSENVDLGPLEVVEEINQEEQPTGRFLLADGYHRWEAHRRLATRPCAAASAAAMTSQHCCSQHT